MKILALIPARGGSKRIPGKNIRLLGDRPLIVWTIDVAKDILEICDVLVSTDDIATSSISKDAGALVPWLRPAQLSTDTSSSVDAALHALDWYEAEKGPVDGLLLLQPTSPFRTKETLRRGIELFKSCHLKRVLGVSSGQSHPLWALKPNGEQLVPYLEDHGFGKRSQDLPEAYRVTGSFYLISPQLLRAEKSFVGDVIQPLLIDSRQEGFDIDTLDDWALAERLVSSGVSSKSLEQLKEDPLDSYPNLGRATQSYLLENETALSLRTEVMINKGKAKKVEISTLSGISKRLAEDATLGAARFLRDIFRGHREMAKLSELKGAKTDRTAIVIGNGPSQGLISAELLQEFKKAGNEIIAVNFWHLNTGLSKVVPEYLVISDPATLADPKLNISIRDSTRAGNETFLQYLKTHESIKLFVPIGRVNYFKRIFGESRVLGFVDTEMRWLSSNIDPRFPRGYLGMTLYKALALAIHIGYKQIYLIGMDNTYPRDLFCDSNNRILSIDRHAGVEEVHLVDQTQFIPNMAVWAQDMFQLFSDLRNCFSGYQVLNLDCYSLTDVFPKINNINLIEKILTNKH